MHTTAAGSNPPNRQGEQYPVVVIQNVNGDLYDVVKLSTGYELPQPKYTRGNDMRKAFAEYKKSIKDEGHQEGVEKRNNEIVTNMLIEHLPIATIEKCTRLPLDQILQIAKANNIQLS